MFENTTDDGMAEEIPETNPQAVSKHAKSRKKDVVVYAQNPFWSPTEVKIGTKRISMRGGYLAKDDTGETISMGGIHRIEVVDETRFVKLFTDNTALFFDLSRPAQKLLRFVLSILQDQPGRDGIWFSWQDCEAWTRKNNVTGLSRPNFHRALGELLHKKLIAESEKTNFFWVNGNIFFNGDRLVYIQEYRKVKPEAKKNADALPAPVPMTEAERLKV